MNPYWINPSPDTAEWLESDRLKRSFYLLVAGHLVLWIFALVGMVFLYIQAQKMSPIEAYTSTGEPAWGQPMAMGSADTVEQREAFLTAHLRSLTEHLFMRTEKGVIPELAYYTDPTLLGILNRDFSFVGKEKGGYSQTFAVDKFELIFQRPTRRVYRVKGLLSSHSLDKSSNTPVYLLIAMDKRSSTPANSTGWVAWVVKTISEKEFYAPETAKLVEEATSVNSSKPEAK